MGGEAMQLGR